VATLEFSRDRKSMSVLVQKAGTGRRSSASQNRLFVKVSDRLIEQ